jgi:uncharacterized membrane protein YtjA (UPF0391 family)
MLRAAIAFLIIALIAGVLGFSGVAGTSSNIAYYLAIAFLVMAVLSFVTGNFRRPTV